MKPQTKASRSENTSVERLIEGESERLVLGNILARDAEYWKLVGPQLEQDYFAIESNRRVFALMKSVADQGGIPNLAGCYRAVIDRGKTTEEMGLPLLSDLAWTNQIDLNSPRPWIKALRKKSAERRAWRLAERLRLGIESGEAPEELAKAREEMCSLEASFATPTAIGATIGDAVGSIGLDALLASPRGMIASPWDRLNHLTNGGPRPGELCLLASRPSVGKTTAALQWGLTAAGAGHRVLFVSLEMPQQDLLKRALSAEGDIPHGLLMRGELDSAWRYRVVKTLDRIGAYPLEINDKIRSMSALIAKIAATTGLALVVVDYLGLIESGGRYENRNQEVSKISRQLKLAALDYGVPIIAAHQLNRASETENRRPQLSDLRDSGSLEQDADIVLMLDAPTARRRGGEEVSKDAIEILIGKQRNGPRGYAIQLKLEGRFCRLIQAQHNSAASEAQIPLDENASSAAHVGRA
jgi:replicative DNA helicase